VLWLHKTVISNCWEILDVKAEVHGVTEWRFQGFQYKVMTSFVCEPNEELNKVSSWQLWNICLLVYKPRFGFVFVLVVTNVSNHITITTHIHNVHSIQISPYVTQQAGKTEVCIMNILICSLKYRSCYTYVFHTLRQWNSIKILVTEEKKPFPW